MVSTEVFSHNSWNNLLSFEAPALEVSYSPLFKDTFFPMKYFSISIQFSQPLTMALHRNQHHFPSYQTHPSNYETLKCATVCIQSTLCLMGTLAAFFDGANAPAYVPFSQLNCTGEPPNRLIQVYTWSGTQGNWWASISQFNSMLIAKEWASWSIFFFFHAINQMATLHAPTLGLAIPGNMNVRSWSDEQRPDVQFVRMGDYFEFSGIGLYCCGCDHMLNGTGKKCSLIWLVIAWNAWNWMIKKTIGFLIKNQDSLFLNAARAGKIY